MAKKEGEASGDSGYPPYIPWKSFENYVAGLKKIGTVPHTLDNSTRPASMAGGMWRALLSALKFLKLISPDGVASENFSKLAKAHGTSEWPTAIKQFVVTAYRPVVTDMPLENATAAQLDAKFRAHSKIDGQLLRRAERFYIHSLHVAGIKYSTLFSMRRESSGSNGKRKSAPKKTVSESPEKKGAASRETPALTGGDLDRATLPKGMHDVSFPIGDKHCIIRIPLNITTKQMPMVQAAVAMVAAMAAQNDDVSD